MQNIQNHLIIKYGFTFTAITNSFIRQIIPIDPNSGLIMISYTDNNDINPYWKDKKQLLKSDQSL